MPSFFSETTFSKYFVEWKNFVLCELVIKPLHETYDSNGLIDFFYRKITLQTSSGK